MRFNVYIPLNTSDRIRTLAVLKRTLIVENIP